MSRLAKISFFIAFLLLIVTVALKFMTDVWLPINTVLVVAACGFVALAIVVDYRLYWEFLTMRTTKHGMNMGAMILTVLVLLICVNYLANKHDKSWDVTQEKLNSLSDQSTKLLDGLKDDVEVKVFQKSNSDAGKKQELKQTLNLYSDYSSHVKVRYINPYVENDLAIKYLNDLPDRETQTTFVFIEHGDKRIRADQPFDEAAITSALIKATRTGETKVYFLQGHGEKDIAGEGQQSMTELAKALGESSFKVESLNLLDKKAIPSDASVVAIVGPSVQYLDAELQWLREYVHNGGKLFIALDPGQHTNLANLTKSLGVEFENNYVVTLAPIVGGGPAMILGRTFDNTSDITRNFPNGSSFSLFYLTSEVRPAPDKPADLQVKEIIKTDKYAFTMNSLNEKLTSRPETKPITLAVDVTGKLDAPLADNKAEKTKKTKKDEKAAEPGADKSPAKEFEAVVFGDSDFLSNRSLMVGVNRDLALNAFAQLASQKDLLSIRPKLPKGTMIVLTSGARFAVVIAGLALPILLLITSGVVWFRRRGA